ncbi:uncharacterized protein [Parasteatoda tepidariorum]|nr:uncharacterized protein LOC107457113 [Parasteatoda tepidariorum]
MDPRGRKKLENYLKSHKKIDGNLDALNIINLKTSCDSILLKEHPESYSFFSELEDKANYLKKHIDIYDLSDRYKEPYANISSYSKTIQDLSTHLVWHSEKNFCRCRRKSLVSENSKNERNRVQDLMRLMMKKINFLINENLLSFYMMQILKDCHQHVRKTSCNDNSLLETGLKKFIKVTTLIPPVLMIFSDDKKGEDQFLFISKLLNLCCDKNIDDSEIVLGILSVLAKIKVEKNVRELKHSPKFFSYILQHVQRAKGHDILFTQEHSRIAWKYCRNFSIIDAVVCGDEQRLKKLMEYGFTLFPADEKLNKDGEFPDLSQVMPMEHRLILEMLKNIQLYNFGISNSDVYLTTSQKTCFLIVLHESTNSFVTEKELEESLRGEYEYNRLHNLSKLKCKKIFERNKNLIKFYVENFSHPAQSKYIFKHFLSLPYDVKQHKGKKVIFCM